MLYATTVSDSQRQSARTWGRLEVHLSAILLLLVSAGGCSSTADEETLDPIEAELRASGIVLNAGGEGGEDDDSVQEMLLGRYNTVIPVSSRKTPELMNSSMETHAATGEQEEGLDSFATIQFELFGLVEQKYREPVEERLEVGRGPFDDAVIQVFRRAGLVALSDPRFLEIKSQLVSRSRQVLGREYIRGFVISNLTIDGQP